MLYKAHCTIILLHTGLCQCSRVPGPRSSGWQKPPASGGNIRDSLILGEHRHPHQLLLALLKHSSIPRRSQEDLRLLRGLLVAYRAEHSGSVKTSYVVRGASGIRGTSLGLVRSPRGCLAAKWSAMFCSALEDTFLLCQEQKLMKDIDSFIKWM